MSNNRDALLDFLMKVWGKESTQVFLAYKPDPSDHGSFDVPKGQKWPEKSENLPVWLLGMSGQGKDVYFSPALYKIGAPSKEKKYVVGSRVLWCDFDGNAAEALAKLEATDGLPSPTWRIQSGLTGHEHWYWLLSRQENTERFEQLNKKLAYYLDADMGCWSAEHVMRPPLTHNTLRAKKYNGRYEEGVPVDFITINEAAYEAESFDFLPDIKDSIVENVEFKNIPEIKDVLAKYKWDSQHLDIFKNPPTEDRSNAFVRVGYHCAEVGMPDEAIYAVIDNMDQRVGKFTGRTDSARNRLIAKIIARVRAKYPYVEKEMHMTEGNTQLVYNLQEMYDLEIKLEYLVPGLLVKNTINFIAAESGIGKSRLSLQLADALARGVDFLSWKIPQRTKVMYLSLEMSDVEIREFLLNIKEEMPDPDEEMIGNFLTVPVGSSIDLESDEGYEFVEMLLRDFQPEVMFIDAMGSLTFGELGEVQAKTINNNLKRLRTKYGTTFFIIHHSRKADITGKKRPTRSDIYGSQYVITDAALCLTMWEPENQTNMEFFSVKTRFMPAIEPVILNGKDSFLFKIGKRNDGTDSATQFDDIS